MIHDDQDSFSSEKELTPLYEETPPLHEETPPLHEETPL